MNIFLKVSVGHIVFFFSSFFSCDIEAHFMQDTGYQSPCFYHRFDQPSESLLIASRYLPNNPVIVEAGAYNGNESCIMAAFWPNGHIHAFEPVSALYENVKARTQGISNISTYPLALSDRCGQQVFYLSTEVNNPEQVSQSSSLYPPKEHLSYAAWVSFQGTEVVQVTTLDQWAAEYGVQNIDLLWLDMQGSELQALKAAPKLLSGVSVILTELEFVEAYEGQPLYLEVKAWLEEQGFVLIGGNFDFPKNPAQWFGDGLFVRRELLLPLRLKI